MRDPGTKMRAKWGLRQIHIILVLLLFASLACSLSVPNLGGSTPSAQTAAPTAAAVEAPPQATSGAAGQAIQEARATPIAPLPPALVEVEPLPESELAADSAPTFYFNQPMDRASVESAFQTNLERAGRIEWMNDNTLRFHPNGPLDTALNVSIAASAKAANGLALEKPVVVSYRAPGALYAAERLPAPDAKEVNPSSAIAVTFNRPVVALGADAQSLPAAFSIQPEANGRGEWLNTSTYIFYPQPALLGGVTYTVRLNESLTSTEGTALSADSTMQWSFSTAAPVLLSVTPTAERRLPLDSSFTLTFNQPMEQASVEAEFSLSRPDSSPVEGTFEWNKALTEVTFQPSALLERDQSYNLVLLGAARSQGGAQIGQNFVSVLATVPQFAVNQTRPSVGESLSTFGGYGSVMLSFSSPVAQGQNLSDLISVSPSVVNIDISRDYQGNQVYVNGYFEPSSSYTLTVSQNLRDRWGATLGVPFSFTFSTQAAAPALVLPAASMGLQSVFVPSNEAILPATATNLTRLDLRRGSISLEDYIRAAQDYNGLQNWQPRVQDEWYLPLDLTPNKNETIEIPITPDRTPLAPGLYFLKIDTQPALIEGGNTMPPLMMIVSPVQMVFKTAANQAFVWAVRLENQAPVENAKIDIYNSDARLQTSCTTDAQGKCLVDLPLQEDPYKPLYAVLGQPGENNFSLAASNWNQGVAAWDFRLMMMNKGNRPEVYLYTDRPIYRPGQAVNFRILVRSQDNGRYGPPVMDQVTVEVVSPYDPLTGQSQVLKTLIMPLDAYGAAHSSYILPEDASPGMYTLRLKELQFEEVSFEVAEYRKPEIDLQVAFPKDNQLTGEDVQATVNARYFFGAPAGNMNVRWSLFRSRDYPDLPDQLSVGSIDFSWMTPWEFMPFTDMFVTEGQGTTNPDGTLTITISGADLLERFGDASKQTQSLRLEVTAEDESGLPVSARASMRLNPSPFYIGVRQEKWSAAAGEEITYTVRSVDWQGRPVADKPLTARFSKVTWKRQEPVGEYSSPHVQPEYEEIGSTDFRTSDRGDARLAFTPSDPGTYMLEITGEGGAVSQLLTWVSGPGAAAWPQLPNQRIEIRSDRGESPLAGGEPGRYKPGETASVFIPNPFPDGALALITIERSKVMSASVVPIQGSSYTFELPIDEQDAPNIYVSVVLLSRTGGRPDFRMGYLEMEVDPSALLLNVEVQTSPEQLQPGGEATFNIRVKDQQGNPVQGEFSLALIDKAVLALADPNSEPIDKAFYGQQPLGVMNSLSLVTYSGRYVYVPPGRGGGGGGDMVSTAPLRTKFEDTAYWNGAIQTDVTGVAQVSLTLPDNLTTWRADVRGLSEDARVGQADVDLIVGKPLLITPVTPRFAVAGDHMELAAVVYNNTTGALRTSVRLEAAGFALDDPNQAAQPVDIQPGERRRVSWWGTVQNLPSLDLVFSVESQPQAGEAPLRDSTRPERGALPVLVYSSPQTFATAGMLADAGQRLEVVSLPRTFIPTGGELRLEISPSLAAAVLDGLKALDAYPQDFTEPVVSILLPNVFTYQVLREFQLEDETLRNSLESAITDGVERLARMQNENGGWGWAPGYKTDPYITTLALFGLSRASQAGAFVDPQVIQKAQDYLFTTLVTPTPQTPSWELDRQAFRFFALQQSGRTDLNLLPLYEYRDKLAPWGKGFLALAFDGQKPGDERARTLVSDLAASANRSATGASWQDANPAWRSWNTTNFTTAVAAYAIARVDPASPVLVDAIRYLMLNRNASGIWASSYETSWSLVALVEAMRGTGDLQASYTYSARLNGSPLIDGQVQSPAQAVNPVLSELPLSGLLPAAPNALEIQRGEGTGRLYYRAYLRADRPAEDAPAINRGLSITRQYYLAGQDCRKEACQPLQAIDLANPQPVQVRLTLTVPQDMYYVVVEDMIPSGTEVLNPRLKTSQQNIVPSESPTPQEGTPTQPLYDPSNPFEQGWKWWIFRDPQVFDDRVRWMVESLPAGTYELTYRLTPYLAGEFRVLPARAWEYYFPEVEGATKGEILVIR